MESDEDSKYPRYGQFGEPSTADQEVCNWCGTKVTSRLRGGVACSLKCTAALNWKRFRYFPRTLPIFLILFLIVIISFQFSMYSLVISSFILILLSAIITYGLWMSWYGGKMRLRSIEKLRAEDS